MYRGVTGERRAWVDEVRSFVYIDNPGGSGTWYSWDADARMSAERYSVSVNIWGWSDSPGIHPGGNRGAPELDRSERRLGSRGIQETQREGITMCIGHSSG